MQNPSFPKLNIDVYADGADKNQMLKVYREGFVRGFTTNPTLMAKAGIKDYEGFAKEILSEIKDLPISFEVFSDEFHEMEQQAYRIASWASNVNVKIPITNTKKESSVPLIRKLLEKNVKLNVTAIFTESQLIALKEVIRPKDHVIVSIFAGRIADTGRDPNPLMRQAVDAFRGYSNVQVLWASPREVYNVYEAERCGCHIITATPDLIAKLSNHDRDLDEFSLDTVKMFYQDAIKAGFQLPA